MRINKIALILCFILVGCMEKSPVGKDTVEVNTKGVFDPVEVTFNGQSLKDNFDLGEYVVASTPVPLTIKVVNRSGYPVSNIQLEFVNKAVPEYNFSPNEEGFKEFPGLGGTCFAGELLQSGQECEIKFEFFAQRVAQISQSLRVSFSNIIAPEDTTFNVTIFSGAPASLVFLSGNQSYIFGNEVGFAKRPVIERNITPLEQNNVQTLYIKNAGNLKARNVTQSLSNECTPKSGSCPNSLKDAFEVLQYDCPETLLADEVCEATIKFTYRNQGEEPAYQLVDYKTTFKLDYFMNPAGDKGALSATFNSIATDIQAIFDGVPSGVNFGQSVVVGNSETKSFRAQNNGFREGYLRKILFFDSDRSNKKYECYTLSTSNTEINCYNDQGAIPSQKEFPFSVSANATCLSEFNNIGGIAATNTITNLDQGCDFSLTYKPSVELKEDEFSFYHIRPLDDTDRVVHDTYVVNNSLFYVATINGVFKTENGGATFERIYDAETFKLKLTQNKIYIITDDGLWVSPLDNINFTSIRPTQADPNMPLAEIDDFLIDSSRIFIVESDQVFETDEDQINWQQISFSGGIPSNLTSLAIQNNNLFVASPNALWRLDLINGNSLTTIQVDFGNSSSLFVSGSTLFWTVDNRIYISNSNGQNFTLVQTTGLPNTSNINDLYFTQGVLYLGLGTEGLFVSGSVCATCSSPQANFKRYDQNSGFGEMSTAVSSIQVVNGKVYSSSDYGLIIGQNSSQFNFTIGFEYDARHLNNEKIMAHGGQAPVHNVSFDEGAISISAGFQPGAIVAAQNFTSDPLSVYENPDDNAPGLGSMEFSISGADISGTGGVTSLDINALGLADDFWKYACQYDLNSNGTPKPISATLQYQDSNMFPSQQQIPVYIVPTGVNETDTTQGQVRVIEQVLTGANVIPQDMNPFPNQMNGPTLILDGCYKARWIDLGEISMELAQFHERKRLRFRIENTLGNQFNSSAENLRVRFKQGANYTEYTANQLLGFSNDPSAVDHGFTNYTNTNYAQNTAEHSIYQDIHLSDGCTSAVTNSQNNCELVMDFSPIFRGSKDETKDDVFDSRDVSFKTIELLYETGSLAADGEVADENSIPITKKSYVFIKATLLASGKLTRPKSVQDPIANNISGSHTFQRIRFSNAGTDIIPWIRLMYNRFFNQGGKNNTDNLTQFNFQDDLNFLIAMNNPSFQKLNQYYDIEPVRFSDYPAQTNETPRDCLDVFDMIDRNASDPFTPFFRDNNHYEANIRDVSSRQLASGESCELLLKYSVTDLQRYRLYLETLYGLDISDQTPAPNNEFKSLTSATSFDGESARGAASKDLLAQSLGQKSDSYLFEVFNSSYTSQLRSHNDDSSNNVLEVTYYNNEANTGCNQNGNRCLGKYILTTMLPTWNANGNHIFHDVFNNDLSSKVSASYNNSIEYLVNPSGERFNGAVNFHSPAQTVITEVAPIFNTAVTRCPATNPSDTNQGMPMLNSDSVLDPQNISGFNRDFLTDKITLAAIPSTSGYLLSHKESSSNSFSIESTIMGTGNKYFLNSKKVSLDFNSTSINTCNELTAFQGLLNNVTGDKNMADYIILLGDVDHGRQLDISFKVANSSKTFGIIKNANLVSNNPFSEALVSNNGFDNLPVRLKHPTATDPFTFGLDSAAMKTDHEFKITLDATATVGLNYAYVEYELDTLIPLDDNITDIDSQTILSASDNGLTLSYKVRVGIAVNVVDQSSAPQISIEQKHYDPIDTNWEQSYSGLSLDTLNSSKHQYVYNPINISSVRDADQPDKLRLRINRGNTFADSDRFYTYFRSDYSTNSIIDKIHVSPATDKDLISSLTDPNLSWGGGCKPLEDAYTNTNTKPSYTHQDFDTDLAGNDCELEFEYNAKELSERKTVYLVIAHTRDTGFSSLVEHVIPIESFPIDPAILEISGANFNRGVYIGDLGTVDLFTHDMGNFTINDLTTNNGEQIHTGAITVENTVSEDAKFINLLGKDTNNDGLIDSANDDGNMGVYNSDGDVELIKGSLKLTVPIECYYGERSQGSTTIENSSGVISGNGSCSIGVELALTASDISSKKPTPNANIMSGFDSAGKLPYGSPSELSEVTFKLPFYAYNEIVKRELYVSFSYSSVAGKVNVTYNLVRSTSSVVEINTTAQEEGVGVNYATRLCLFNQNTGEVCSDSTSGNFQFNVGGSGLQSGQKYLPRLYVIKSLTGAAGVESWTVPTMPEYSEGYFITTPTSQPPSSEEFVVPPVGFAYDHQRKNIIKTSPYFNNSSVAGQTYSFIKEQCSSNSVSVGTGNVQMKLMKIADWDSFIQERFASGESMSDINSFGLPVFDDPIAAYVGKPNDEPENKITYLSNPGGATTCYPTMLDSYNGEQGWIEYNCLDYNMKLSYVWCYADI